MNNKNPNLKTLYNAVVFLLAAITFLMPTFYAAKIAHGLGLTVDNEAIQNVHTAIRVFLGLLTILKMLELVEWTLNKIWPQSSVKIAMKLRWPAMLAFGGIAILGVLIFLLVRNSISVASNEQLLTIIIYVICVLAGCAFGVDDTANKTE